MKQRILITHCIGLVFLLGNSGTAISQKSINEWQNLFDGKTLSGWKKLAGTAEYIVVDGAIMGTTVMNTGNTFLVTEKEYGDFEMEMEVMIMDTTGNSGMQIRSHYNPAGQNGKGLVYGYQVEIDPTSRKWSGGIYDEGRRLWLYPGSLNPPAQNAFKVGVYNHIRIECIGNEIKTWINDIPVAYLADAVDARGFIGLQVHAIGKPEFAGQKVYWKNIKIRTNGLKKKDFPENIFVVNTIPNHLTAYEKSNGWKLLFNGKDTSGWKGAYQPGFPQKGWKIKDGAITVLSSQGKEAANGGDIVTRNQFDFFDLSFEFKITPGANSGIKYFVTLSEHNTGSAIGLEYQVLDDATHPDAKLGRDGNRTMASLYDLLPANKQPRFLRKTGEWNSGRITVSPGNHVTHYLNGVKVLEYERGSQTFRELVAESKYKIWPHFGEAKQGHILLQDHGNEVSFRSIKIREL